VDNAGDGPFLPGWNKKKPTGRKLHPVGIIIAFGCLPAFDFDHRPFWVGVEVLPVSIF